MSGTVSVSGSVAVTGSFYQATQPVSIATMPSTPVTGTFWQTTQPVSGTFWQTTQPVSIAATVAVSGPLTDTQLRASPVPVSGTFYQATQPVSGTVAFSNTTIAVTGTFWQTTQPVSGTFWQTTQPVSIAASVAVTNAGITSIDGKTPALGQATMANSVPVVIASNQSTLNVTPDTQSKVTYAAAMTRVSTGALTANTLFKCLSIEKAAASSKTTRIRSIKISGYATSATAGTVEFQLFRGTAASSGGSSITPQPMNPGDAAADTVVKSNPTIVAATGPVIVGNMTAVPATANSSIGQATEFLVDLGIDGAKSLTLRQGSLDALCLQIISTAAITVTLNITAIFTEE